MLGSAQRFAELCREDTVLHGKDADSIGTYNEKRVHRIFKRYLCENAECYEVSTGRYVADVLCDGTVFEIQTASFRSLTKKVDYYLNSTDCSVVVLHPIIHEKTIVRMDAQTGEVIKRSRSPKRGSVVDALVNMYYLREFVAHPRFCLRVSLINATEYRFSEAVRGRKSGKYDHDLVPETMVEEIELRTKQDYLAVLPPLEGEFDAAHFSKLTKLKNRKLYSVLNFLCHIGALQKRSEGRKNFYKVTE
jgi:hypothetical protein